MVYNRLDDNKPKGKQPVDWGDTNHRKQYDCVQCDGYNMMCTAYTPVFDKPFVVPCKVMWNMNDGATLEDRLDNES